MGTIVRKLGLAATLVVAILLLAMAMNAIIIPNVAFTDYYPIHDGCNKGERLGTLLCIGGTQR